jgi:CYTH domain-containing protein
MIELELTYLAKYLPTDLAEFEAKEMIDIYIPKENEHPKLRIRKNGDKLEMTKKYVVVAGDASKQIEETIILSKEEYEALSSLDGKKTEKRRYLYPYKGRMAEIDVFGGDLDGLVIVDFEFETEIEKEKFEMPEFCLAEVTQETVLAGGMLCGKKYADIEET